MNLIERPPLLHRLLIPGAMWRCVDSESPERKVAYLTFDDGPIPEVTPWVLDVLDRFKVKATFFMVGENVRRHPHLLEEVKRRGHSVGNHTMHHTRGLKCRQSTYMKSVEEASEMLATTLFRPPHGFLWPTQLMAVRRRYSVVMHDLVTMDYDRDQWPWRILERVRRLVRPGSIIVFHDSLKAERNLRGSLEGVISMLKGEGYEFRAIPSRN